MQSNDALRAYYKRVVPIMPELFNMAHAICGNYDLAEYAVQYMLQEMWHGDARGGMGFRDGLRNTLRRVAFEEALEPRTEAPELTWNGLGAESDEPVLGLLAAESVEIRRMLALRYGCGLPNARIARLVGVTGGEVREALERFEQRVARKLPPQERRRAETRIAESIAQAFRRTDDAMPSLGAIYRSFEAEVSDAGRPGHLAARIVKRLICVVLAAVCAAIFWLTAALMRPVQLESVPEMEIMAQEE